MTKSTIQKSLLTIGIVLAFLIAAFIGVFSIEPICEVSYASDTEFNFYQGKYENYTDTDVFVYNGISYFIEGYADNAYLNYGNVTYERYGTQSPYTYNLNVSGDNAITQIVPKELFMNAGNYLYIGKEYGFFINTAQYYPAGNMKSTVMVFDIETQNLDLDTNAGIITVITQPLFQKEYIYLSSEASKYYFRFGDGIDYSQFANYTISDGGFVIQHGNLHETAVVWEVNYDYTVDTYYLKDISYAMMLQNEQDPNEGYGAAIYDPYEDTGSYFTYYDYKYEGTARRNGEFPVEETVDLSLTVVQMGLSMGKNILEAVPGVGTVLSAVDMVIDMASTLKTIGHFTVGVDNYINQEDVSINNGTITATNYYTNRDDQLEHYGSLMKSASVIVNTSAEGESIWYKPGDKATGYFQLGHSALNGQHKNYTRFNRQIALKVVKQDESIVAAEYSSYDYMLRDPEYKNIPIETQQYVYLLEKGTNYFHFTPQFTSDYTLTLQTGQDISININGTDYTSMLNASNGSQNLNYRFTGGETYSLIIKAIDEGCIAALNIEPNDSLSDIDLDADDEYLVKFSLNETVLKTLNLNTNSAVVKNVYTLENNAFVRHEGLINYVENSHIDLLFDAETEYYVVLSADVDATAALSLSDIDNVSISQTESVDLSSGNYVYLEFADTENDKWYIVSVSDVNNNAASAWFKVYTESGLDVAGFNGGQGVYYFTSEADKYYVGVKVPDSQNMNIRIEYSDNSFEWEVSKIENGIETFLFKDAITEYVVSALTPSAYRLTLWINDSIKAPGYFIAGGMEQQGYALDPTTGILTLTQAFNIGTNITVEGDYWKDQMATYKYRLTIKGRFIFTDFEIKTSINYANKMEFSWTPQPLIEKYVFNLNYITPTINDEQPITVIAPADSYDLLAELAEYNAINTATVTLSAIIIDDEEYALDEDETYIVKNNKNISVTLNCMYSRYEAKKPIFITYHYYYIANALQLYNIRYDMSYTRHIENDIDLSVYTSGNRNWTPIPSLDCNLYGGRNKITNLKYYIGTGTQTVSDIGLVGVNNSMIINVIIDAINISSAEGQHSLPWVNVGGIAGVNNGMIVDCKVTGSIIVHRSCSNTGGIVGKNTSNGISGCDFGDQSAARSVIDTNGDAGGIAGYNSGLVIGCNTVNADIKNYAIQDSRSTGGIVGYCPGGTIKDCTVNNVNVLNRNPSTIDHLYPKMGLIVGHLDNGILQSVGSTDSYGYCGGLTPTTSIYCFNGDWPFYGKIDNSQIDNSLNVNGP